MQNKSSFILVVIFVVFNSCYAQNGNSLQIANNKDIVFIGDFEGSYNDSSWKSNWGIAYVDRGDEAKLVVDAIEGEKSFRVGYPEGGVGPRETGTSFPIVFDKISSIKEGFYNELYLRYYVKFEEGFDFVNGGKLPGLMGGGDSWTRSGGNQPDGTNGWTMRFMWRTGGRIVVYAYVPQSGNGKYGSETWGQDLDCDFIAKPGKWHCIEQYVNIGTPNKDNGILTVWIDGEEKLNLSDLRYWNVENNFGRIGGIYFSTFHGGNTKDWAPINDSYAQFDGFIASKKRMKLKK